MAKNVELEKLLEGLTLTDEEKKVVEGVYGKPENLEVASRRYLRRDEGTRLTQEAATAKAEAEALRLRSDEEIRKSEAHMQAMSEWETGKLAEFTTKEQALEAERLRFRAALLNGGIDPESEEGKRLAADNAAKPPAAFDYKQADAKYLDRDTAKVLADVAVTLPLAMAGIQARHRKLFGADADADWAGFQAIAKDNLLKKSIPVDQTAEEFFKFGEKEEAAKAATLEARLRSEIDEEYRTKYQQAQLSGQQVVRDPNDRLFTQEFAERTKDSKQTEAAEDKTALDHFLTVNAELERSGIRMEH